MTTIFRKIQFHIAYFLALHCFNKQAALKTIFVCLPVFIFLGIPVVALGILADVFSRIAKLFVDVLESIKIPKILHFPVLQLGHHEISVLKYRLRVKYKLEK